MQSQLKAAIHAPSALRAVAAAIVLALTLAIFPVSIAAAPSNKFDIVDTSNGKKMGHASYSIDKTKTGYKISSTFSLLLSAAGLNDFQSQPTPGVAQSTGGGGNFIDTQYSYEYKVDANGAFLAGYGRNAATQTLILLSPSKNRDSITVTLSRTGTTVDSQTVTFAKPDFFVLPSYDPAGIQVLITAALEHPHVGNIYLLLIPANVETGQGGNSAGLVALKTESDVTGSLGHQSMSVKHYSMMLRGGKADIYTDDTGNLMEVDMAPLHASYIRSSFALTPKP